MHGHLQLALLERQAEHPMKTTTHGKRAHSFPLVPQQKAQRGVIRLANPAQARNDLRTEVMLDHQDQANGTSTFFRRLQPAGHALRAGQDRGRHPHRREPFQYGPGRLAGP